MTTNPDPMTSARLAAIKAYCEAATASSWRASDRESRQELDVVDLPQTVAVTDFIAQARTDLPALVAAYGEAIEQLSWALDNLPTPTHISDPEYGLHHEAARAIVREFEGETMNFDPNVKDDRYPRVTYRSPEFIDAIAEAEAALESALRAYGQAMSGYKDALRHFEGSGVGYANMKDMEELVSITFTSSFAAARRLALLAFDLAALSPYGKCWACGYGLNHPPSCLVGQARARLESSG